MGALCAEGMRKVRLKAQGTGLKVMHAWIFPGYGEGKGIGEE